jgi:GntP family gluconate:H+ symporter
MVETLNLNLGFTIIAGIGLGVIPALAGLYFGKWLDGRMNIQFRESPGIKIADIEAIVSKKDNELPSFLVSMLPVALPVFLIAFTSFLAIWTTEGSFYNAMEVLGNKNVAMFIGALIALYTLAKQKGVSLKSLGNVMEGPLGAAGTIILITSAGGAFGAMIRHAGVGDAISMASKDTGLSLIILSWVVAAVLKVAQGSGTVSMITTSGIVAAIIGSGADLGFSPIYLFAAIAFGSQVGSWMNDSGFWVVQRLSGFTEKETLKTWSVLLTAISLLGLVLCLLGSALLPLV